MGYLSDEDFNLVYSKAPRLAVDLCIRKDGKVLLSRRCAEPYAGSWHMPGGTLYKDESIKQAAIRIAKRETGLAIVPTFPVGYLEFRNEMRNGIVVYTVSIVMMADVADGELEMDEYTDKIEWFSELPDFMVDQHKEFLQSF